MSKAISYKTKQFLLSLIKIGLVVAAFYFIYTKLFKNSDFHFDEFKYNLMEFSSISMISVLFLAFLSFLNWFVEILKWQTLINSISEITLTNATRQTLGALTASLFTPNRIGEYGAKAMYYPPHHRKKIMLLNGISNSVQMLITTVFGVVGFSYFTVRFQPQLNYSTFFIWLLIIGFILFSSVYILKMKWFKKQLKPIYKSYTFLKSISTKTLFNTLLLSLMRYLIFSFQFYYLLLLFGIEMDYFEAMAIISTMYLLSSIMPSILIFDIVIKGGVAIYLFGLIGVSKAIILTIITLMWLSNFVLPSIIGSYFVLSFKLPKTVS